MSLDYNRQYYKFIVDQIKDIKYCPWPNLCDMLIETSKLYSIHPVDKEDFKQAFDWAIADVFGGGCEYEYK